MVITRRRVAVVGLAAVAVVGGLVAWNPFDDGIPDVPSCKQLKDAMPAVAGGTWNIGESDEATRKVTQSSTTCGLAFTTADQRVSGTVRVLIIGEADDAVSRTEVENAPCYGVESGPPAAGYLGYRACVERIQTFRATVAAAKPGRWANVLVSASGLGDAESVSQDLAAKIADQCLTLEAD